MTCLERDGHFCMLDEVALLPVVVNSLPRLHRPVEGPFRFVTAVPFWSIAPFWQSSCTIFKECELTRPGKVPLSEQLGSIGRLTFLLAVSLPADWSGTVSPYLAPYVGSMAEAEKACRELVKKLEGDTGDDDDDEDDDEEGEDLCNAKFRSARARARPKCWPDIQAVQRNVPRV